AHALGQHQADSVAGVRECAAHDVTAVRRLPHRCRRTAAAARLGRQAVGRDSVAVRADLLHDGPGAPDHEFRAGRAGAGDRAGHLPQHGDDAAAPARAAYRGAAAAGCTAVVSAVWAPRRRSTTCAISVAPGNSIIVPPTTTESPAATPLVTSTQPAVRTPRTTGRRSAFPWLDAHTNV